VRDVCIISPLLFHLYSEFMMGEAMEDTEGVKIDGKKCDGCKISGRRSVGGRQDGGNAEDDGWSKWNMQGVWNGDQCQDD
jgi:hypothetical protein